MLHYPLGASTSHFAPEFLLGDQPNCGSATIRVSNRDLVQIRRLPAAVPGRSGAVEFQDCYGASEGALVDTL
jgi:hypothetical protein